MVPPRGHLGHYLELQHFYETPCSFASELPGKGGLCGLQDLLFFVKNPSQQLMWVMCQWPEGFSRRAAVQGAQGSSQEACWGELQCRLFKGHGALILVLQDTSSKTA